MSKLNRKKAFLAKMQPTSNLDSGPTAANAILCRNLEISPIEGQTVSRDVIRAYFGNSEQLPTAVYSKITFEIEIAGSGTAGTEPAYGPLLRSCAFSETILGAAHTGTAQAGATDEITLAGTASATDDAYAGLVVSPTGGTGSGDPGRTIIDYNGTTKVAKVDSPFLTTPDNTTVYNIPAGVAYGRVSTAFEMSTMHLNVDGIHHVALDCKGDVGFGVSADRIPVIRFDFTAIYVDAADASTPATTLTAWQQPLVVNQVNTPVITLHSQSIVMESANLNMGNQVIFRSLPGGTEQTLITNSNPSGDISFEAVGVASKDYFTAVKNADLGSLVIEHGTVAGNRVRATAPRVQLSQLRYGDSEGIAMFNANLSLLPINGGDDFFFCVY